MKNFVLHSDLIFTSSHVGFVADNMAVGEVLPCQFSLHQLPICIDHPLTDAVLSRY
jgi:hypothetical protein